MAINTGAGSGGIGFEQGSTWGTAVACGANDQVRTLTFNDGGGFEEQENQEVGNAYGEAADRGDEAREVVWTGNCYYGSSCGRLLSYIFGTSGAPTNNTGSYTHTLTMTDVLTKFMTIIAGKRTGQKPWEYASMKARRLLLRAEGRGRLSWELTLVGGGLDKNSSTNTTTELAALTIRDSTRPVLRLGDATFRINAQGGSALASTTDDVQIVGFEMVIERQMPVDFGTESALVLEPFDDGDVNVMLTIDYRAYSSDTFIDAWDTDSTPTEYKADIVFSSGITPASGQELTWTFSFPRLQPKPSTTPITGRNRIAHRVSFKCLEASSAPSGMSGITKPVHLVIEDEDSGTYLS